MKLITCTGNWENSNQITEQNQFEKLDVEFCDEVKAECLEKNVLQRRRISKPTIVSFLSCQEDLIGEGGGGPRSLVRILKCLVSAFFQGFMSLSEIERQTFVLVII